MDTCIVFESWHISTNSAFVFSCFAIIALGILFEYLRALQKNFDTRIALSLIKDKRRSRSRSPNPVEEEGLLTGRVLKPDVGRSVYVLFHPCIVL